VRGICENGFSFYEHNFFIFLLFFFSLLRLRGNRYEGKLRLRAETN
jgi:hypothetical protein